jgi:MscS family membrane protein
MEEFLKTKTEWISGESLALLQESWVAIPNWKWIALGLVLFLGMVARPLLQYVFGKIKKAPRWHAKTFMNYLQELPTEGPLAWVFVCLFWLGSFDALSLGGNLQKYLSLLVQIIFVFQVIRMLYIGVDAISRVLADFAARTETTMDDQLVPMASKTLKILIVVMGVLIALQNFGVNVASVLAGLGLGGLAFALAAKDTAANVFGSITILLDAPFKIGDMIKVGDSEGIVEDIGFRSTRLRTVYNSLVTIPNSVVANEKIDNTGARHKRRVRQVLGLLYETPPKKVEEFVDAITYHLHQHQQVDKDTITVTFNNFNASTLDILVNFHLNEINTNKEEQDLTQAILLDILGLAQTLEVEFAYPTQTLYLKSQLGQKPDKEAPHPPTK